MGKAGNNSYRLCVQRRMVRNGSRVYQNGISGNKYHNKRITVDGESFDSKKEYARYQELKLLEKTGQISDLRRQVPFELIPHQVVDGKVIERAVKYIADFVYMEKGLIIVEDVKSDATRTDVYKIKKKLMLSVHGMRIREV